MYGYKWIESENGIFKLDVSVSLQKEIRPVFKEELDLFGLNEVWDYPDTDSPLLWAEGIRKYILNGKIIAEAVGGGLYHKPKINILDSSIKKLEPIDICKLTEVNSSVMNGLIQKAVGFIRDTYNKYVRKGYKFAVVISGGKDSVVLLDLVQRALAPDEYVVIFSDTGMEISATYESVGKLIKHYSNINFHVARSKFSAADSWDLFGPPGRNLRWCCSVHKSVPTMLKLKELCSDGNNVFTLIYDGVRAEESERRSHYTEISNGKHINQINCSPIFAWNSAEVFLYILSRNILFNDAYRYGANRVGCTICPLSTGWRDCICNFVYGDDLAPFIKKISDYGKNNGVEDDDIKKYCENRKWASRIGGRGLQNGGNRVYEVIEDDKITFNFISSNQKWLDVSRILGPIVERTSGRGLQVIKGITFNFNIDQSNGLKVSYSPYSAINRQTRSWLRGISNKVAYCVGCKICEVECPTGAFVIDENNLIKIDSSLCVHCERCIEKIDKGCKVAKSLSTSMGIGNMKFIGMNRYTTLGLRESFLEHFFDLGNDCWTSKALGNLQYASLKIWLREAEIIEVNPTTDKNGQITELGEKLKSIGLFDPFIWAVIWTNLSYNSQLIKWYLLCVNSGEIYSKSDLVDIMGDEYSQRQKENAVSSLCETLGKSPIGSSLEMGIPIPDGKSYRYYKKGWSTPDLLAVLYALYRYAEKLEGHYEFTLKEMNSIRKDRPNDFIGMDPITIFALDETEFKDIVIQIANNYPEYITKNFVADLDNIFLSDKYTSLDIVELYKEGLNNV